MSAHRFDRLHGAFYRTLVTEVPGGWYVVQYVQNDGASVHSMFVSDPTHSVRPEDFVLAPPKGSVT